MNETEPTPFEVHDREALAKARAIMNESESPRQWAQAVVEAVQRNAAPDGPYGSFRLGIAPSDPGTTTGLIAPAKTSSASNPQPAMPAA